MSYRLGDVLCVLEQRGGTLVKNSLLQEGVGRGVQEVAIRALALLCSLGCSKGGKKGK